MPAWDWNKRLANLANHGVDFRKLGSLDWSAAVIFEDVRRDYGERRMIAMARLGRRLHAIVHVDRGGDKRFILTHDDLDLSITFAVMAGLGHPRGAVDRRAGRCARWRVWGQARA